MRLWLLASADGEKGSEESDSTEDSESTGRIKICFAVDVIVTACVYREIR